MEENYSHFGKLILGYISGQLNPSEQAELDAWIAAGEDRHQQIEIFRRSASMDYGELIRGLDKQECWKDIQAKVAEIPGAIPLPELQHKDWITPRPVKARVRPINRWWGVAAGVLLVSGSAVGYFYSQQRNKVQIQESAFSPARQIAVLFYNDEPKITLDGTQQEVIRKGSMNIYTQGEKMIFRADHYPPQTTDMDEFKVSTPRGGKYEVVMPDSSDLQMNVASLVKFTGNYGASQREIDLQEGEVLFNVAPKKHTQNKPFVVHVRMPSTVRGALPDSNRLTLTATGTAFNVAAYAMDATIRATLLEGSLLVQRSGDSIRLKPGQIYILNQNGSDTVENVPNISNAVPWRQKNFVFAGQPINQVFEILGRWYGANIVWVNGVSNEPVSLKHPMDAPLREALDQLQSTGKIHYTINNDTIFVSY